MLQAVSDSEGNRQTKEWMPFTRIGHASSQFLWILDSRVRFSFETNKEQLITLYIEHCVLGAV